MVDYLVIKSLHLLGAVLLLGNVTVTGVWSFYLYRHWRDGTVPFRPIARAILWTDLAFTAGGGAALTVSGVWMILRMGYPVLQTPWLLKGIVALSLSTLSWLVVLLPDQVRLEKSDDPAVIRRLFQRWSVVGWASTALLFYALWVMVTKR
ncbi:MAG: DUF2269 family protein [Gemmatimonadales bacterium]|nr:DUF2269 family protein [Gemmatimonadales bacterium]